MTTLLEFREKIKIFLSKYDIYLFPLLKFILAMTTFLLINGNVGFMSKVKSPAIALILALMCSFLPLNTITVFAALLILAHAYALSLEVFALTFVVMAVMFLLFFRTAPQYGYVLLLTPLAFVLKVPYAVPLIMGLVGGPVAAVPVACGTVIYYLLHYMKLNTTMISGTEADSVKQKLTYLVDNVLKNREMLLMAAAFALTLIIVYVIRRMSIDYAWSVAVGVGAVVDIIVILVGSMLMNVSIKILPLLLGSIVAAVLASLFQLTVFSLDYSRTEYVQFEDDEYYYYVKAVPKITIAVSEKKVKKISSQRKTGTRKKTAAAKKQAPKQAPRQRRKEPAAASDRKRETEGR
jgi:uncharacterized protein (DUF697 family)